MREKENRRMTLRAAAALGFCSMFAVFVAGNALAESDSKKGTKRGTQYCVSCFGETYDMTSKRTCYEITAPTQIHMRAFGVRQCTTNTGNLWYNFSIGSCKRKRFCTKIIKR